MIAYGFPIINGILTFVGLGGIVGAFIQANLLLIALLPIFIVLVVIAPYRVWKKLHDELIMLKEKRLEVTIEPQTGDPKLAQI